MSKVKNLHLLCLSGAQSVGKTTLAKALAGGDDRLLPLLWSHHKNSRLTQIAYIDLSARGLMKAHGIASHDDLLRESPEFRREFQTNLSNLYCTLLLGSTDVWRSPHQQDGCDMLLITDRGLLDCLAYYLYQCAAWDTNPEGYVGQIASKLHQLCNSFITVEQRVIYATSKVPVEDNGIRQTNTVSRAIVSGLFPIALDLLAPCTGFPNLITSEYFNDFNLHGA